ncbi:MAG: FkbM family methyltransferase [Planctomycetota bacterium]
MNTVVDMIIDRTTPYQDADFLPHLFGPSFEKILRTGSSVVLFGTGSAGKNLLPIIRNHGVAPVCFCDNNPVSTGQVFCGLPVLSFSQLTKDHRESLIVITTNRYSREIRRQLLDAGFHGDRIFSVAHGPLVFFTHIDQWRWPREDLNAFQDELEHTYTLLSDDKSKDLFINRIALFAGGTDYQSFLKFICKHSDLIGKFGFSPPSRSTDYENFFYFNNDVVYLDNRETFVDVGAYDGDSTEEFLASCKARGKDYRKVFCFEPDTNNFSRLQAKMAQNRDVTCLSFGLWTHAASLNFESSDQIEEARSARVVSGGGARIQVDSLDHLLPNETVTFIKMDVEGAECEALRGASWIISRDKPKLAISVYHSRDDIFRIPLLVHEICPEYRLYLRLFSYGFTETVLLAIPA